MEHFYISTANIILTNKCNSRCSSCYYWRTNHHNFLSIDIITSFLKHITSHGATSVLFTGGEPTEHPHLAEIVKMAKEQFGLLTILSTNGLSLATHFLHSKIMLIRFVSPLIPFLMKAT